MKYNLHCLAGLLIASTTNCGPGGDLSSEESNQYRWKELPIRYSISTTVPESFRQEIQAAFASWEQATNTKIFEFNGVENLDAQDIGNENHLFKNVVFALPGDDFQGKGEDVLARTYLHGVSAIRDADIYIFNVNQNFENGRGQYGDIYSLKTVMMHEIGHMLFGPEHSTDSDSILYPTIYPENDPRQITGPTQNDIDHFFAAYGDVL